MPVVFFRHIGQNLAYIHSVEGVDPGFGMPGGGVDPDYGMGEGGHPGHGLPRPPARPGHELPHLPGVPDHSLPTTPPPHVQPGVVLVLARDAGGVWHWAALPPGSPSPTPLPVPPPTAAPKA